MTMIVMILLAVVAVYLIGYYVDEYYQYNYFIGGVLPFMGYSTYKVGDLHLRAFLIAWFWKGIAFDATLWWEDE